MGYGLVCGFVVCGCGLHRKIRPTQLWVELSWVVAISKKMCFFSTKKKLIFTHLFGTASVRSRSLDQPLVPGVFIFRKHDFTLIW